MEVAENVKQEQAVEALSRNCRQLENLEIIPELVVEVIENDWWKVRRPAKMQGKEFRYNTFQEFVEDYPPQGLGVKVDTLKKLCRDNERALVAIREAGTRPNYNPTGRAGNSNNNIMTDNKSAVQGTYKDYTLYRLKKDHPELYERVLNKELSANKAAIEAGFRRKMVSVEESVAGFVKAIQKRFSPAEVETLVSELTE